MKIKKFIFTSIVLLYTIISYSQNSTVGFSNKSDKKNPDRFRKNSISYNIHGTTQFLGISYERILAKGISVEAGLGILSFGVGIKGYLYKITNDKINYHIGLSSIYCADPIISYSVKNYLPIGATYFWSKGLLISADFGPLGRYDLERKDNKFSLYGNIKVGWRF